MPKTELPGNSDSAAKALVGVDYFMVIQACESKVLVRTDLSREHRRLLSAAFQRLRLAIRNAGGRVIRISGLIENTIKDVLSDHYYPSVVFCSMLEEEAGRLSNAIAAPSSV